MLSPVAALAVLALSVLLAPVAIGCGGGEGSSGEGTGEVGERETGDRVGPGTGGPGSAAGEPGGGDEAAAQGGSRERPERRSRGGRPRSAPEETAIKTDSSQFGEVLWDADDQAIYMFEIETSGRSECYDDCAVAWPPVLTEGKPRARGGVDQDLLGVTRRDDGSLQVTYNDHPLYYYVDEAPGELRCHNVSGFGGLWLALDPAGNPA